MTTIDHSSLKTIEIDSLSKKAKGKKLAMSGVLLDFFQIYGRRCGFYFCGHSLAS